jgi:hypothetical protein
MPTLHLSWGEMRDSESLEGDEWTTYVVLARIQVTECRIV